MNSLHRVGQWATEQTDAWRQDKLSAWDRSLCLQTNAGRPDTGATRPYRTEFIMPRVRIVEILCIVLAAGCAAVTEKPPIVLAQSGPLMVARALLVQNRNSVSSTEAPGSVATPPVRVTPVAPGPSQGVAKVSPALATGSAQASDNVPAKASPIVPAKLSPSAPAIGQPVEHADSVPVTPRRESPLDVAALKARLRDTSAIGVFTKLALKNQVDDLLQRFRALYQGGQKTSVATLRQPYDLLLLKVLALLQDSDPPLARTISGSREAIWGILADPEKFKSVT